MAELKYQFRQRLTEVHKKNRRIEKPIGENQVEVTSEWKIAVPKASDFLIRAGRDLEDYFFTSMNVELSLTTGAPNGKCIVYATDASMNDGTYRIEVSEDMIKLLGKTERAAAQAGYFLEDLMNLEEAPYIDIGANERTPRYRVRMVHSGFDEDQAPNEYLNAIAHHGMNVLLLMTRGSNHGASTRPDFNDIIDRAAKYGIDVYAYSAMRSRLHPDDPGAEEFYDSLYGDLFRRHPGFKGIVFVGESVEFPSHDERTTMMSHHDNVNPDGTVKIKDKPSPGWFPCRDYPDWVNLVKRIIRREQPDADIVFWSYNWGRKPEELRIELIENLPTDISLEATFEMFEDVEREGVPCTVTDYSLFQNAAGKYFISEAKAARRKGVPLYSMTNTAGLTWDVGTVPYEPAPYQWIKRFDAVNECNELYGLCGLMESHHYGFWPSFISELAKWCFTTPRPDPEKILEKLIVRDFGSENLEKAKEAFRLFSDAVHITPSTHYNQYAAMRVGPSYPFVLFRDEDIQIPFGLYNRHGRDVICDPKFDKFGGGPKYWVPEALEKLLGEIRLYKKSSEMFFAGANMINEFIPSLPNGKRDDARRVAGIAEFMGRAILTTHNCMKWHYRRYLLKNGEGDRKALLNELLEIAENEIANAEAALPLVDFDSRLGYEPSMDYMGHREAIEWKLDILKRIVSEEIPDLAK